MIWTLILLAEQIYILQFPKGLKTFWTIDQEDNTKNMAPINNFFYHPGSSGNMFFSNNGNSGGLQVLLSLGILLVITYIALFITCGMRCQVVSTDNVKYAQKEEMDEECWNAGLSSTLAAKFFVIKKEHILWMSSFTKYAM